MLPSPGSGGALPTSTGRTRLGWPCAQQVLKLGQVAIRRGPYQLLSWGILLRSPLQRNLHTKKRRSRASSSVAVAAVERALVAQTPLR